MTRRGGMTVATLSMSLLLVVVVIGFVAVKSTPSPSRLTAQQELHPRLPEASKVAVLAPPPPVRRGLMPERPPPAEPRGQEQPRRPLRSRPPVDDPEVRWAVQNQDAHASDELTKHISDALDHLQVDGDVDEVDCRETLCRVRVHFGDIAQAHKFESEASVIERRKKIDLSITDGTIDVEVFVARE